MQGFFFPTFSVLQQGMLEISNIIQVTFNFFFHSSSNDNISLQLSLWSFDTLKTTLLEKSTGMPTVCM